MTEPRDPDSEPRPPEDSEPHGLAEGIRQEIEEVVEEVVEHVPRPVRWTVGKLLRLTVLALFGLVVVVVVTAILYVTNRTEWAARELALLVNQALVSHSDVAIEIGDLKGNLLSGVRVVQARLRFREGDEPALLEAPEIRFRYSAWALATGGRGPIVVEIDRPVIRLSRGADGKYRLPIWKSVPARGPGRARDFTLRLRDAVLFTPDTALRVRGLDLDAHATIGAGTRLDVRSLRWSSGPYRSVLEACALEYAAGDSARLTVRELRTGDLTLRGLASWAPGAGEAAIHLEADRLRWRWLYEVTGNHDLDVDGEGRVVVDARGGRAMAGRFEAAGVWDSLKADARGGFVWRDGRLRVEPLVGRSPAGDLNGAVTWSKAGWELNAQVRRADPSRWSIIGIRNWPAGNLNGHIRYTVDTRRVKHARLAARLAPSEWSGWRADSGAVAVDFTPAGSDSFSVLALRRGGAMTLRARTDDTGWSGSYTLARFPLDEWAEGRASGLRGTLATGSGSAASHRGRLEVTGTLEGGGTDWLGIHTARWRMSRMQGDLLPVPDLRADVRLEDFTFLTVHWDSAGMPIHVGDRTVALPSVTVFAGDTVLTLQARADWEAGGWSLAADSARIRSGQFDWTAESPMRLSGDPRGVNFNRLVARDGDARLTLEGRWAGPGGAYDWRARVSQLDLGRLGFPREWKLSGSADGELHVTGMAGDPRWVLSARARRPGAGGHFADSVVLDVGGAPSRLDVRAARAMLDGGTLTASGEVTGMVTPWPDSLTGPGMTRWLADASRWNGTVSAQRLPVEGLGALIPAARGWKGRAGGTMELAGRPGAPEFSWKVDARPLSWGDYRIDEAAANGRFREGHLEVSQMRMTRGTVASSITGSMPLRLAVGQPPSLPEQPMDWRVDLPDADLALLPLFVPQIGAAAGRFDLSARLTGTGKYPKLAGSAKIRDGRMRLAGREEQLEALTADLTLTDTLITLNSLSARQRKRQGAQGLVEASGVLELSGLALKGYRFDLRVRDFTAVESGFYAAEFDGRFVVTNASRRGRTTLPLVVGGVELRRAVVSVDFANQTEVERIAAATKQLYWLYRIQLSASDKLRWKPPAADIEFSADLSLEQTRDSLIIYGDMTALRGTYHYLSNKFTMERVNLAFDNVGGVNPKLDIVAMTRVRQPASVNQFGSTATDEMVTVAITGRAAEPVMTFSSDAGSDQPTILRALTIGPLQDQGLDAGASLADDWVTRNLNRQLSSEVSRLFQGYLDEVELARETGGFFLGQGAPVLGIGIPIAPRLGVRYRQRVGAFDRPSGSVSASPFERDVEAEYRINRFFYVSSKLTQRRTQTGTSGTSPTAPEFNLNLKARWEY
jgi:translocation-and-assembly-module (TAM) inner membrane subunit TamB-like protein